MRNYSIKEFRDNMREALNLVEAGEIVQITRFDTIFEISIRAKKSDAPSVRASLAGKGADPSLINTVPARIKTPDTPFRTDEEWQEAEGLEKPCCKLKRPCQHWVWNDTTMVWQNTLSGRERTEDVG
jgi:hypothetical protein